MAKQSAEQAYAEAQAAARNEGSQAKDLPDRVAG